MKNYNDFLGIKEIKNDKLLTVVLSSNRDILYAGRFYYPIIATNINNNIVISCSSKIAEKCLKKDLIPTYWVNKNNIPSRRVAEKAGFELLSKEMVVSIDNANN